MSSYYYLMAQLPFLFYENAPPMQSEEFKKLALSQLNKKDASLFKCLSLEFAPDAKKCGCKFIDGWYKWNRTLRLNLAKYRLLKLYNKAPDAAPPLTPDSAYHTAETAFDQDGTPLDGEVFIDKARWDALDALAGNNYFDRSNVYAYYLKLLLIERRQLFNTENGFSEYKSLYAEIIENAQDYVYDSTEERK